MANKQLKKILDINIRVINSNTVSWLGCLKNRIINYRNRHHDQ